MENNWEPYIGQKVVALESSVNADNQKLVKGRTYTVEYTVKCPCCGRVNVSVVEIPPRKSVITKATCANCLIEIHPVRCFISSSWLAPVNPAYADCTSEIAKQFKEHPDTVDVPVKVLENN